MRVCQFNFNNEVDTFEIHVDEETKRVTVPGSNGETMAAYDSIEQLAEMYALARDVKPENLKNWVLLENGDVYSFVLRAGTAGLTVSEAEEQLEQIFDNLGNSFRPYDIARAKQEILADGDADVEQALISCSMVDVAREVYDAMAAAQAGTEVAVAEGQEEADDRSELEVYIDGVESIPGAIGFLATIAGLPATTAKEDVVAALQASYVLSNVDTLKTMFNNTIDSAIENGIGVNNASDAILVITQTASGEQDEELTNRLVNTARMAGRNKVNITVLVVGHAHIRHTAELIAVDELAGIEIFVKDNTPYIVRFSETVDAELEAERDAAEAERAAAEADAYDDYEDDEYGDEQDYDDEDNEDEGEEW